MQLKNSPMKLKIFTTLAALISCTFAMQAQTVVYSLPSTTVHLNVKAVRTSYTPGPYAGYAKKYLGIDVQQKAGTTYTLGDIKLTPYLEADRSQSYVINLSGAGKNVTPLTFLEFSSQGLIMLSDGNKGMENTWRFPSLSAGNEDMLSSEATGNLTSTETVLHRTELNESGEYELIAYKQSQVVEKSMEKKAQEAASMILTLRQNRVDIITGNTDATFSGDALRAAIEEIGRIEKSLMSLFIGTTSTSVQSMSFDVVPDSTHAEELIIAFRISDTQGLLPADDISGRPVVMEIIPEEGSNTTEQFIAESGQSGSRARYSQGQQTDIHYRIPAICTIKITDGQDLILQNRLPVYQKGQELTFPVSVLIK